VASDLDLAFGAVDAADGLTLPALRRPDLAVETKADRSPVTEVDRAVEAAIRRLVSEDRPGDAVLGEEMGTSGGGARRWVVDPIDGTVNFIRGAPVWATLLALQVDGEVVVGMVSAPALGRRWWAERGAGAFTSWNGQPAQPLRTSSVGTLGEAAVSTGCVSHYRHPGVYLGIAIKAKHDRGFGDFWQHMLVAEGALEAALEPVCSLWDLAALQVIVEEAGGKLTDFSGARSLDSGNGLSSNGLVHEEILSLLSRDGEAL
jgi:histidinol-phosphatase